MYELYFYIKSLSKVEQGIKFRTVIMYELNFYIKSLSKVEQGIKF